MAVVEARFRVMGSACHVAVVDGDESLLRRAESELRRLERRWSRFIPGSDIDRLNRRAGSPVPVDPDTLTLVSAALELHRLTGGWYDPTVLPALVAHGYAASRHDPHRETRMAARALAAPAPGCAGIEIDVVACTVTLPVGVAFDPGGIGKGLAADLVAELLVESGASGALVNVGGDLRVTGRDPDGDGWYLEVENPFDPEGFVARLTVADGGLATSSTLTNTWEGGRRHHLIDPHTGRPSTTPVVAASVVAGTAWLAEGYAKAALLAGPRRGIDLLESGGVAGLVVLEDGDLELSTRLGVYL